MFKTFVIACLSVVMLASGAFAQTAPPAPDPNQGAFDKLSPGNQKIAQALFDAEQSDSTATTPTTTKSLSRDDIAAMKQDGKGWGEIFKEMKKQGLVDAKNLGQVVSQANHTTRSSANGTVITSGSGRSYVAGTKMKPESTNAGAGQNGNQPQFTGAPGNLSSGTGAGHSNAGGHGGRGKN